MEDARNTLHWCFTSTTPIFAVRYKKVGLMTVLGGCGSGGVLFLRDLNCSHLQSEKRNSRVVSQAVCNYTRLDTIRGGFDISTTVAVNRNSIKPTIS